MRFATPVVALIAAALLAGCGSVAAPKPNPAGDAAFVTALKLLCSKTPALAPIDASASMATITSAADANNTTVTNFYDGKGGLLTLTPSISSASPLALPVTDAAEMLVDVSKWYVNIVNAAKLGETGKLSSDAEIAVTRGNQARSDLAKIGVTNCLT
jgi:hypothetical protein